MVEEKRKLRGYCNGTPIFEIPDPAMLTKEEMEDHLLSALDIVQIFPNGKSYFEYANDEYFMAKDDKAENPEADLSFLVKVNKNGDVIGKRKFDILVG
jgi:hypothetical protein